MNKFSYKFTLRKDRKLRNGDYPLYLVLIHARTNKKRSLNIALNSKNWNEDKQVVKKGDTDCSRKNKLLTIYKNRIINYETECIIKKHNINLDDAIKALTGEQDSSKSFYGYIKQEWKNLSTTLKPSTLKRYKSHIAVLKRFKRTLYFSDIDLSCINMKHI